MSMILIADFFIDDLVKTIIEIMLPIIPKRPIVTSTGPYMNSSNRSSPNWGMHFIKNYVTDFQISLEKDEYLVTYFSSFQA